MPVSLNFEQVGTFPYPDTTTGVGTALTCVRKANDPYLAFVTQTTYSDDIVLLHLDDGDEVERMPTPTGRMTISGMAYDVFEDVVWACQITDVIDEIFSIDLDTGSEVTTLSVSSISGRGLACNGIHLLRGSSTAIQMYDKTGNLLGTRTIGNASCTGLTAAPWSYVGSDTAQNTLWIFDPFEETWSPAVSHRAPRTPRTP